MYFKQFLHDETGCASYFLASRQSREAAIVDPQLGQLIITVVHTPGHRPESVCLLVTNPPRSPMPSIVLSGDTLFVGDVGRPDFGGPDGAHAQYASIRRLLELEDYLEVFPAHFEGSCGKGMC